MIVYFVKSKKLCTLNLSTIKFIFILGPVLKIMCDLGGHFEFCPVLNQF